MGIFNKIFQNNNKKTISEYGTDSIAFGGYGNSYSLSEKNIMQIPEFYSAIDMIADSIAQTEFLPTKIEFHNGNTLKNNVPQWKDKYYRLLNKKPNEFMDAYTFWKQNIFNYFLRGGFYLWINKTNKGIPLELIPIDPSAIEKVKLANDDFAYELSIWDSETGYEKAKKMIIPYKDIIAINYASLERVADMEFKYIYGTLLEQLGLKNNYDSTQLRSAPRLLAHVKATSALSAEQHEQIKKSLTTFFQNAKTQDKSAVLVTDPKFEVELLNKEGAKVQAGVDNEFVKSLLIKLANALHIPIPKLNIMDSGTSQYKSLETIQLNYLTDAVAPILHKIIGKLNEVIYGNLDNKEFTYSYEKLLQFDKGTLGTYTEKMHGTLTINEIRKLNGFSYLEGFDKIVSLAGNPVDLNDIPTPNEKGGVEND